MSLPIDDTLSLPVIFAWVRINWGKMVLGGVVCTLLAFSMVLLKAKSYDAALTLLVSPPTFKAGAISEMMPRALPVETYKVIALSAPLLDEVIRRVPLEDTGVTTLEKRLEVGLVEMGTRSAQAGVMYTKALTFHATARKPELAAKIVQVWADVFKEQVDRMATEGVSETFSSLETLYTNTKTEIEKADLALAEHRKLWDLDLIKAQLEAKKKDYTDFEGDLKQTEVKVAAGELALKSLEADLAQEPDRSIYFRAPSDDAYWIAGLDEGGKSKTGPDKGLRTEEENPTYTKLKELAATAKEQLEGLKATKETIVLKLDELKKEMDALTVIFADKTVERNKLTRESESLEDSYKVVRAEHEKARMADQTQASDIVMAGKAVVPDAPSGPGSVKVVIVAAVVGMFLTAGFLAFKEISDLALAAGSGLLGAPKTAGTSRVLEGPSSSEGEAVGS